MTTEKQSAQDRGIDLINELVEAHLSSIDALRITSHSGGQVDNLTVALHEFYKYEPGRHDEFRKRTEKTIERAKQQERVKFLYLRRALLIALCSSLEIIVKDVFAENTVSNQNLLRLPKSLFKEIDLEMFDKYSEEERLEFIDKNFKRVTPEIYRRGHAAIFRFWLQLVDLEPPADLATDNIINQAFQARNIAVHGSRRHKDALMKVRSRFLDEEGNLQINQETITELRDGVKNFVYGIGFGNL